MSNLQVKYLIVHHSSGPVTQTKEDIKKIHLAKGYSDIGYHKIILANGKVEQGRNDAVIGAQAFGANAYSLGICCIGNYETSNPPEAVIASLVQVLVTLCKRHNLTVDKIIGHRDVAKLFNVPEGSTACPGKNLYARLDEIRTKVKTYLD